jgi:pSer/pThr/pTyr-binding forkhead associated (FHA) protein
VKLDVLEFVEKRLAELIEKPLQTFFPGTRADQLLAKRLVQAMSDDLSVDAGGRLVAPVYYEIKLNPTHTGLWTERPGLAGMLAEALLLAAHEQKVTFERSPVIGVTFDIDVPVEDIQVITLEMGQAGGSTTAESPLAAPQPSAIPADAFLIINGDRHVDLKEPVLTIGRSPTNQLVLDDPQVSRVHAQLRAIDGAFTIIDLDSTCGTLVNGEPVTQVALRAGDTIVLGDSTLIYGQESVSSEETTSLPVIPRKKGKAK